MLQREPVTTDARLAAHLARLDRDAVKAFHAVQCTAGQPESTDTVVGVAAGLLPGPGRYTDARCPTVLAVAVFNA